MQNTLVYYTNTMQYLDLVIGRYFLVSLFKKYTAHHRAYRFFQGDI